MYKYILEITVSNRSTLVTAVRLDLSKAFDTINHHQLLIHKLHLRYKKDIEYKLKSTTFTDRRYRRMIHRSHFERVKYFDFFAF